MFGILKYRGQMRYDEYLKCVEESKGPYPYMLEAVKALGIVKPKYNPVEKLVGHIQWRVILCVRYVQRIMKKLLGR